MNNVVKNSAEKCIILVFPDLKLEGLAWHRMPFSVLAVAAPLVHKGLNVKIFDERFEDNIKKAIHAFLPDAVCVGFSVFTGSQISGALEIAESIRKSFPRIPLVWGGWHASIFPEQTAGDPRVDIVVYGQGERTFLELVEALLDKRPIENTPGLCYKRGDKIVKTQPREPEDINNFSAMPLNLVNLHNYIGPHDGLTNARTLSYISSQGCPNRCGFCADKTVYQRRWFGLESKRVITEVSVLVKKYSLEAVFFEDSNFFVNKRRVEEICRGLIDNQLNIKWEAMGHTRQLVRFDDNFWNLLKKSGCSRLLIGAESGDQEVLDLIKKDATVQDTINLVKKAKKHKMAPILSTMVGFPRENQNDFKKTINLAVKAKRLFQETEWKLFLYTPYPGTPLYRMALEYGMKEPRDLFGWSKHTLRDVKTPWIDEKFRAKIRYIAFFYFQIAYPSTFVQQKINQARCPYLIKPIFKIVQLLARVRLALNFYFMPVEPALYNFFKKAIK